MHNWIVINLLLLFSYLGSAESFRPFLDLPVEDSIPVGKKVEKEGSYMQKIRHWDSLASSIQWEIEIQKAGSVTLFVNQSYAEEADPGSYSLTIGEQNIEAKVEKTDTWHNYKRVSVGNIEFSKPGKYIVQLKPISIPGETLMCFDKVTIEGTPMAGSIRKGYKLPVTFYRNESKPVEDKKTPNNSLSKFEVEAGWKLLFDGETFTGWTGFKNPNIPNGWHINEGALCFNPTDEQIRSHLMTSSPYANYEFVCEWKIAEEGDSGIFLRFDETKLQPFEQFVEYQIFDNNSLADSLNPKQATGAAYDLYSSNVQAFAGANEWNHTRIILNGSKVEFYLNHQQTANFDIASKKTSQLINQSKFHRWADFGKPSTGFIGLQDYHSSVSFRNLKIRKIQN